MGEKSPIIKSDDFNQKCKELLESKIVEITNKNSILMEKKIAEEKARKEAERAENEARKKRAAEEKARKEAERADEEARKKGVAEEKARDEARKKRVAEEKARKEAERADKVEKRADKDRKVME